MKSKQIYALLLSTTIIASAFPVEAASYDNVVDAIKAVNNGTDASATSMDCSRLSWNVRRREPFLGGKYQDEFVGFVYMSR